ncbi:shikimate dehydrogenase [Alishewanella sp. HL-SH05]|uniref:shikimate dehydrogenase n=1 Tax=Alishewanella sp. HL-SH05 TaxID=3461145 RepID=UPI0040411151
MDRYAVFGNPIGHSKSPFIHQQFALQTAEPISYEAILAPVEGFADSWQHFINAGGKGANVTMPFKEQAFALAQVRSEAALQAGAVNTLYFNDAGQIVGDNTDGVGLLHDLQRLGVVLAEAKVLIIGAGGATRGIVGPLLKAGVGQIVIANRTQAKAEAIAANFNAKVSAAALTDIPMLPYQFVINATSSGLTGQRPEFDSVHLAHCQLAYDMLYGASPTAFLVWCQQQGVQNTADGLGMLVGQAAAAFALFRGKQPDMAPVLAQLKAQLAL